MLNISKLSVKRREKTLFSDMSFNISPGTAVGLTGANGTGKSSLILSILDLIPYSGTISKSFAPAEMGVVWQDRGLPLNVSPSRWFSYLSNLYSQPIDESLTERFELDLVNKPIRSFSGGEQQKIAIVSAFFHKPKMLILDEPTVGLDEQARSIFYDLCSHATAKGSSILITSHLSQDISAVTENKIDLSAPNSGGKE